MKANTSANDSGAPRFEFWFEFASTYSYLSAARIADLAKHRGVTVEYRPFLLGPIFQAQGWNDSPFNIYPAKGRYMWRDLERKCAGYGIPYSRPTDFPRNGLRAARIATALVERAETADYVAPFVRAVYAANFAHDHNIAEESVLKEILETLSPDVSDAGGEPIDPAAILALSKSKDIKDRLRERTTRAGDQGIFGAPSFVISTGDANNTELFWGDDRLEDAFDFYQKTRPN